MKKLIILSLFIANYSFGQSITIMPATPTNSEVFKVSKEGIGIAHFSSNNAIGVGTFVNSASAFIQTHTNHPLRFTTNNGNAQMTLLTDGNFGINTTTPSQKLHVVGNGYFTGNLDSDGLVSANTLTIGGGTTITKYNETLLTGQQIFGVVNNTCDLNYYAVTGVNTGDTVILNMESPFSTLVVANVRASGANQVEVKFCNIGNSNTNLQTGLNMRFTVIK